MHLKKYEKLAEKEKILNTELAEVHEQVGISFPREAPFETFPCTLQIVSLSNEMLDTSCDDDEVLRSTYQMDYVKRGNVPVMFAQRLKHIFHFSTGLDFVCVSGRSDHPPVHEADAGHRLPGGGRDQRPGEQDEVGLQGSRQLQVLGLRQARRPGLSPGHLLHEYVVWWSRLELWAFFCSSRDSRGVLRSRDRQVRVSRHRQQDGDCYS